MGRLAAVAMVVVALALSVGLAAEEPVQNPQAAYGVDIEFVRDSDAGSYTCTATITDLVRSEVVAAPRLTAKLGDTANALSRTSGGEFALSVTADEDSAGYELVVRRDGAVVAQQKASLSD